MVYFCGIRACGRCAFWVVFKDDDKNNAPSAKEVVSEESTDGGGMTDVKI